MIPNQVRLPLLFAAMLVLLAGAGLLVFQSATPVSASNAIPLQAPPFQDAASPQDATALTAIADEAGIAAYFSSGSQISLASVRDRFRTIEAETGDYIIGSIDVVDYPESFDVHAYIHRDGWFMTYYLAADPTSKMLDLVAYTGGPTVSTIFEEVLTLLANEASVVYPGAAFWHFQHPTSNRLMIIAEDFADGNTFTVKLPSNYIFAERAWASEDGNIHWWYLDGQRIEADGERPMWVGALTATQMGQDKTYTVAVGRDNGNTGALVLVYSAP